ncbi:MAG TPA: hypothetical protein VHB79_12990 [Polyangiaceae bacterium]|nr:hypothetical protein [Polyangiaceae bacterium]
MEDIVDTSLVVLGGIGLMLLIQGTLRVQDRALVWLAFVLRIVSAVAMVQLTVGILGGGDMINYHKVGVALSDRLGQDFETVAPVMARVLIHEPIPLPVPAHGIGSATGAMNSASGFVVFLGGRSIYGACAMVGFAAFFTGLAMYQALREELPEASAPRLLVSCLLVPSVVFWSSALLKESIVLSGVFAMVVGGQWMARHHRFITGGIAMAAGAFIVAILKAYILVPFGVAAGVWFYMIALRREGAPHLKAINLVLGSIVAVVLILGTGKLFPEYSIETFPEEAARHQEIGTRFSGDADYMLADEVGLENADDRSMPAQVALAPLALVTALFRPFIFEASNAQMLLNCTETSAILGLAILAGYRQGLRGIIKRLSKSPLLMFCLVFACGLGLGVGLATTNLGTLSRYRMPLVPFFVILLFELGAPDAASDDLPAADRLQVPDPVSAPAE